MIHDASSPVTLIPLPTALLPTPLHYLDSLRSALGNDAPRILIKRDDLTGLALGGNKARKLGYLLSDAKSKNADTVITCGAAQSNHALQTAMAASKFGFDVHCVLYGNPPCSESHPTGNLLLHTLTGTNISWTTMQNNETRREQALRRTMRDLENQLSSLGKRVYSIPTGGSTAVGSLGYVKAVFELQRQISTQPDIDISGIYFASGSGGTQAGIIAGAASAKWESKIIGVEIDPVPLDIENSSPYIRAVDRLTRETFELLNIDSNQIAKNLHFESRYTGNAYGLETPECMEAIRILAVTEGIVLDPVYTGKAMAALLGAVRSGHYRSDETILFWHTGGAAGLFK